MSTDLATYQSAIYRFGEMPSTVTSYHLIWPVVGKAIPDYININSPQKVVCVANNATDAASSTGARAMVIQGLSSSLTLQQEQVWLDGFNPTTSSLIYTRVIRGWASRCGSNGTNAGSLYFGYGSVTSGVPASILGQINAGDGQTSQVNGTIAASTDLHIHEFNFYTGRTGGGQDILASFQFRTRQIFGTYGSYELGPWRNRFLADTIADADASIGRDAIVLRGPLDIEVKVKGSATGARASAIIAGEFHRAIQTVLYP